jgi:hypothetical protein
VSGITSHMAWCHLLHSSLHFVLRVPTPNRSIPTWTCSCDPFYSVQFLDRSIPFLDATAPQLFMRSEHSKGGEGEPIDLRLLNWLYIPCTPIAAPLTRETWEHGLGRLNRTE